MKLLTPRQQEILQFIQSHLQQTGFPPTRAEICKALGFRSPNAAEEHLKALERKGALQLTAGASRGIRLVSGQSPVPSNSLSSVFAGLTLPLVGRVAAGSPVLATEHIEQHFQVDTSLFKAKPDYLLKVRGLSMRDAGILDGDLLAVKALQGLPEARNGQMVVARLEDEVTVKWFERQGHTVWLKPDNPDYRPIEVDIRRQSLTIEGLGVGIIRGF
ncbi:LexA SOS-response transcriptional repressors (RecA-mediated autopeptidases) [Burkholderiales bacterium]|jgi:repressor LexA